MRNAGVVGTIKHTEHAKHTTVSAQQRDGQQLLGLVLSDDLQIRAGQLPDIVRGENFLCSQGASGNSLRENGIHAPRLASFNPVPNPELAVFEQSDEAPAIGEKVCGAHYESLQKMFEVAAGAEFGRNFEQLMQFVGLTLRRGGKLGVRNGDRSEAGYGRYQRLLLGGESAVVARIDQNRPLRARSAEGRSYQNSGRNQAAERMLIAADRDGDDLSGGYGTLRQVGGEADGLAVMPSPEGIGHLRRFGRIRLAVRMAPRGAEGLRPYASATATEDDRPGLRGRRLRREFRARR